MNYISVPEYLFPWLEAWIEEGAPMEMHWLYDGYMIRGVRLSEDFAEFSKVKLKVVGDSWTSWLN